MTTIYCEDSTCKNHSGFDGICLRKDVQMVIGQDDHLNTICVCDDYEKNGEDEKCADLKAE